MIRQSKWQKAHKKRQRTAVYNIVRTAKRRGLLGKAPTHCPHCGERARVAKDGRILIQSHHPDYSKPLEIEWLCVKCHRKETPAPSGDDSALSKLTGNQVRASILLHNSGFTIAALAVFLGVNRSTLNNAMTGATWKSERTRWANEQASEQARETDRVDALRYRWLRHGDNDEQVMRAYQGPTDGSFGQAFLLRNDKLDSAIDDAMHKQDGGSQ